jgi:polysaccharide deacetylase
MSTPLYVTFTMDCERIAAESPTGGPVSMESSERSISGFCDRLLDAGFPPTLFCVPELGEYHADTLRGYADKGVELAMHLHPQTFLNHQHDKYLGEYDRETQKQILGVGLDMLTKAFGTRPTSFRSGNDSANDETFGLLDEMGFTATSTSLPGRIAPNYAAMWEGAYPFVHWASGENRLETGSLPLIEFPLTTDRTRLTPNGQSYELRIEHGGLDDLHRRTLETVLPEMDHWELPLHAICALTHNMYDYANDDDRHARTVDDLVEWFRTESGREVIGATVAQVREHYVNVTHR